MSRRQAAASRAPTYVSSARSRRFYSTLLLPEADAADQRRRRSRRVLRAAAVRYASVHPGFLGRESHGRGRKRPRTGPRREGRSGVQTARRSGLPAVLFSVWLLTWHFRLLARGRRRLQRRAGLGLSDADGVSDAPSRRRRPARRRAGVAQALPVLTPCGSGCLAAVLPCLLLLADVGSPRVTAGDYGPRRLLGPGVVA
jgi:hypothetical protein